MKLKTKLIPLTGLAAIGATIAPIAMTSCGSNSGWIDLTQKYNSTVKALDSSNSFDYDQANEAYFGKEGAWRSDSDVINQFKDDYLWYAPKATASTSSKQARYLGYSSRYSMRDVQFEDIRIGHQKYTWVYAGTPGKTIEVPTISYKLNYRYTYDSTYASAKYSYVETTDYAGSIVVTNMPIEVKYIDSNAFASQYDPLHWQAAKMVGYYGYYNGEEIYYDGVFDTGSWVVEPNFILLYDNELDSQTSKLVWNYVDNYSGTTTDDTTYSDGRKYSYSHTNSGNSQYYVGLGTSTLQDVIALEDEYYCCYPFAASHYLFNVQYVK